MPLCDFAMVFRSVFHKPKRSCLEKGTFFFFYKVEMKGGFPSEKKHDAVILQKPTPSPAKQLRSKVGSHPEGAATVPECDIPVTPPAPGRGRAEGLPVNPLLPSRAGLITLENFTETDHCLRTGSYFGKLCADPYGIYLFGDFSSLFNIGICWYGSAAGEERPGWKKLWSHH